MTDPRVTHATFVIERTYGAPPRRVYAAFADPALKQRWFMGGRPGCDSQFDMDFRVGGRETSRSVIEDGPVQGATLTNDTMYLDLLEHQRIVFAYTLALDDSRISASLVTIELIPLDSGTRLVFTDQGAYFAGADGAQMREDGWRHLLERLASTMAGTEP
jgi:uncharacterized protein YndB with AHSA1/START domain